MCQQGILGDEQHLVCECPALRDFGGRYEHLFQAPQSDAMILFIGQNDISGVAQFVDTCLEREYTSAGHGLAVGHQVLISPKMAGKDS
jgi:hypothetical protein